MHAALSSSWQPQVLLQPCQLNHHVLLKVSTLCVPLKTFFGLGGLMSDEDFVSMLTVHPPILFLQSWWGPWMGILHINASA